MEDVSQNQLQNQSEVTAELLKAFLALQKKDSPGSKVQGHGKTHDEMKELHDLQRTGQTPRAMANAGGGIEINKHDEHLVHAFIENVHFDQKTGERLSRPILQAFDPEDFKRMVAEKAFVGLSVTVVHDPAKGTAGAKEEGAKILPATAEKVLTKDNLHTFNPKDLRKVYSAMFPAAKGDEPPAAMRAQILTKLESADNADL